MNSLFDYFAVIQPDYEHLFEDTTNNIPVRDSTITDIVMSELCVFNCWRAAPIHRILRLDMKSYLMILEYLFAVRFKSQSNNYTFLWNGKLLSQSVPMLT